jgi:isoquinoline 1-oxidoreductase alpha subunit
MITLTVNGQQVTIDAPGDTPLLWALRDYLGFTGTKYGCGIEYCGACTVHIDGEAEKSCQVPLADVAGKQVTTIEGLVSALGQKLQQAWIAEQVPQCGYCQSGMLMSAAALLQTHPTPTNDQIDSWIRNLCVCGTYPRIRKAIHRAAAM